MTINNSLPVGALGDDVRNLVVGYAPAVARAGLYALFALDDRLASIVRSAREPMIGQMRLTWWFEALERLDARRPPAEPILSAIAASALSHGVSGTMLATTIDGWELLLGDDTLSDIDLDTYAAQRGGVLFEAAAHICGAAVGDPVRLAGEGWALADLARHVSEPDLSRRARLRAMERLAVATRIRWSRQGRALGALAHLAFRGEAAGAGTVFRLAFHRFTGR